MKLFIWTLDFKFYMDLVLKHENFLLHFFGAISTYKK